MLSKNNYAEKHRQIEAVQSHFSIRKLTVGAASVLIGMSLYFGNNVNLVKANSQEPEQNTEETDKTSKSDSQSQMTRDSSLSDEKTDRQQASADSRQISKNKLDIPEVSLSDEKLGQVKEKDIAKLADVAGDEKKQTFDLSKVKENAGRDKTDELKELSEEKAGGGSAPYNYADDHGQTIDDEADGIKLSVNKKEYFPTYSNPEIITLSVGGTAGSQTVQPGGEITIKIPLGNYRIGDYDSLNAKFGTTSITNEYGEKFIKDASGNWYCTITDNFTKATQTITQSIYLNPYEPLFGKDDKWNKNMSQWFDPIKTIEVEISDGRRANISFTQIIKPSIDLQMQRAKPKPGPSLLVNHDYTWQLTVNEQANMYNEGEKYSNQTLITPTFNSSINDHATITVHVPASFVLNVAATEAANNRICPVTVSQAGKGRDVIFTIGHGNENDSDLNEKPYYLVGKFDMNKPETNQTVNFSASADQTLLYNLGRLTSSSSWQDVILGDKDASGKPNDDNRPVAQDVDGQIYGYQTNNKIPFDHTNKVVLNHISFTNENNQDLTDVAVAINIPSGFNATSFDIPPIADNTTYNYTVTLADGETKTGTCTRNDNVKIHDDEKATMYESPQFDSAIRKIVISGLDIPVGEGTTPVTATGHKTHTGGVDVAVNEGGIDIYGTVAEKYDNGQLVNLGDKFTSTFTLTAQGLVGNVGGSVTQTTDKIPPIKAMARIYDNQTNVGPGQTDAGSIRADYDGFNKNSIFYFVVPKNAIYRPVGDQTGISQFKVGNRTVIKVTNTDLSTLPGYFSSEIYFSNTSPAIASVEPIVVYLVTGQDENHVAIDRDASEDHIFPKVDDKDLAYVEGNKDVYLISLNTYPPDDPTTKYYWKIMPVKGTGAMEAAEGNTDSVPLQNGTSDDHGSVNMTFHNSIANSSMSVLTNVVSVSNLPQIGFQFQLDKNGVKVIDENGQGVNAEILYSTTQADLSNPIDLSSFVTGAQISDWSKIRSVAVKLGRLDANESVDVVMNGTDPTLPVDAGKKASLTSRLQADGLGEPFIIRHGTKDEEKYVSTIKVIGESTVKSRLHYKDDQGNDQYIDLDLKHTYQDNQDMMKKSDFALRDVDRAKIPTGYHLSKADPTIINSGIKKYANNYPNDVAAFDKIAKYYFDGDIVQYELVKDGTEEKYTWTVKYKDEQGNSLISDFTVGTEYKGTDSYDVTTIGDNYKTEITVGDNTYSLVKGKTKNGSGNFGNKNQTTVLVYKLDNKKDQKYKWIVEYHDELGNSLEPDVTIGTDYKGTDNYNVTTIGDDYKTEITVGDNTYSLVKSKTRNGSGNFDNKNQTTILVYKLKSVTPPSKPNPEPTNPPTPTNPGPAPTKPAKPTEPIKPTKPGKPKKPGKPNQSSKPRKPGKPPVKRPTKSGDKQHKTDNKPKPRSYDYNYIPRGERQGHDYYNQFTINKIPKGQKLPNSSIVNSNGHIVNHNGQIIGYLDRHGKIHYTLPRTGGKKDQMNLLSVMGLTLAGLGILLGYNFERKRRKR